MSRRAELASQVEKEESGLSDRDLVLTAYVAYRAARSGFGTHLPEDIGDLDDESVDRFVAACAAGRSMLIEAEASDGASASTWKDGALRVCHELGIEEPGEPDILCAEALLRHLCNAMDFDPEEDGDLAEHAGSWKAWAEHQALLVEKRARSR